MIWFHDPLKNRNPGSGLNSATQEIIIDITEQKNKDSDFQTFKPSLRPRIYRDKKEGSMKIAAFRDTRNPIT